MGCNSKFLASLCLLTLVTGPSIAGACMDPDSNYKMVIGNVRNDLKVLKDLCAEETCTYSAYSVTFRSHHDGRVAVIVTNNSVTSFVPKTGLNPETYDWKASLREDLSFLKNSGVLTITDSELAQITSMAVYRKNIYYCGNVWKTLDPSCFCEGDHEDCVDCVGASIAVVLPEKPMAGGVSPIETSTPIKETTTSIVQTTTSTDLEKIPENPKSASKDLQEQNPAYATAIIALILIAAAVFLYTTYKRRN